jgi:hypothetical protein
MLTNSNSIMSGIRDNHKRGIVGDFLKSHIRDDSALSFVSAFFTIYAYDQLREWLVIKNDGYCQI